MKRIQKKQESQDKGKPPPPPSRGQTNKMKILKYYLPVALRTQTVNIQSWKQKSDVLTRRQCSVHVIGSVPPGTMSAGFSGVQQLAFCMSANTKTQIF